MDIRVQCSPAPSRSACGGQAPTSWCEGPFSRGRRSERDSAASVPNQRIKKSTKKIGVWTSL